jgi:hypothetical protein
MTMLSDAHQLGTAHTLVGASGTPQLIATEQEECRFWAIFQPEN